MATPTLKRSWGFVGLGSSSADLGNSFKVNLEASGTPCAVASGDLILVSVAFQNGLTCTVSGDVSGSFTSAISVADTLLATPRKFQIFWVLATGVDTVITVSFGSTTNPVQIAVSLWYNVASSSPIDGAGISATQVIGPTVASGSFTPSVSGDLIYNIAWNEQNGNIDQSNFPITNITFETSPSVFTGLFAEVWFGQAAQYFVQSSAAAINPTMVFTQTGGNEVFTSISIAIKAGTGGSAPGSGIQIVRSQMYRPSGVAGNQAVPFPTSGNLVVVANDVAPGAEQINTITDSNSNTYTAINKTLNDNGEQLFHADNAATGSALKLTINLTNNGGTSLFAMYDIAGAATSPLDTTAAAANASVLTNTASGATTRTFTESSTTAADCSSITPSTANGLIICPGSCGNGPITACTTATMDYVPYTGISDNNGFANGDMMGHFFNPTAATRNFTWTVVNNAASISGMAVAFKAAPVSGIPFEDDSFNPALNALLVQISEPVISVW